MFISIFRYKIVNIEFLWLDFYIVFILSYKVNIFILIVCFLKFVGNEYLFNYLIKFVKILFLCNYICGCGFIEIFSKLFLVKIVRFFFMMI